MFVLAAAAVGFVLLVMNPPQVSKVVLLPDAEGKAGAVIVKTQAGARVVNAAYGSASVNQRGGIRSSAEDGSKVTQQYGGTLTARPASPISYIVSFEFGSAVDVTPADLPILEQLRAALLAFPAAEITVIGHTDSVGTMESNDRLSLQRAETVRTFILNAGIQAASVEVAGRGERELAVQTADEVAEVRNRRVEINMR
ncbi:MAG: OmpA family protein [Burkholderiaceae bacterium]